MGPSVMNRIVKRCIDIFMAGPVLLVFAPLLGCVALLVRLQMGRPVFFRQVRPGYKAKPFTLIKFRTMTSARCEQGRLLPDEQRLTKLGVLLRRYSIDELPQLWNVLKGDMSLVGPRPLLMRYLDRYTPHQARRHDVKPGLTGWAQVNGRNALTWEEKFDKDVWYANHISTWLDAKIVAQTIWYVFRRRGINQPGMATAEEFMGTHQESAGQWMGGAEEVGSKQILNRA
jgi:lipopolysaccharide/colanic/teichoic acid biosynthesis glycosyltransferase